MREYDARSIFTAIGICWTLIGLILITFIPSAILNIRYVTDEVFIGLLPKWSLFTYGTGVVFIGLAALLLGFIGIKRNIIIISIFLFMLSIPIFFFASKSHETISANGFEFQRPFTFAIDQYSWENVEIVNRHDIADGNEFDGYEIIFSDGTTYILEEDNRFLHGHQMFLSMVRHHGIDINYNP